MEEKQRYINMNSNKKYKLIKNKIKKYTKELKNSNNYNDSLLYHRKLRYYHRLLRFNQY